MRSKSFSFWALAVLTLGNYYFYNKGREDALEGCDLDPYSDWQNDWKDLPTISDFAMSRPVRGNAKKGTNY